MSERANATHGRLPALTFGVVGAAVVGAYALAVWVAQVLGALPPLPARSQADAFTGLVSALGDLTARLAAFAALGGLAAALAFTPVGEGRTLTPAGRRATAFAGRAAQVWCAASALQTVANAAFVVGVPLGLVLRPDAWWTFVVANQSALAWLFSTVVAAAVAVTAYVARSYAPHLVTYVLGACALAFVGVTGNVSVGLDHDWATDAMIAVTLAFVPLGTSAIAVLLRGPGAGGADAVARVRRYHVFVLPLLAAAAAAHLVVTWQELAGTPLGATFFSLPTVGIFASLAVFAASWLVRQVSGAARPGMRPGRAWASVVPDAVATVGFLAFSSAANHIPPPRFLLPQSTQVNYLGYEIDVPATIERLAGLGRPNILWVLLATFALVAYAVGLVKVHRRGERWPISASIPWFAGWLLTLYLAVSGLWEYSTAVFSWHMLVHMTVNMLVPALCVLGAPFALVQLASRRRDGDELPGFREATLAVQEHDGWQRLFSPPVLWLNYVSSLFLVYYTPLFPWLMRYHWAHQLMLLYFMVTGYLFFNLLIGTDRQRWDLPHLVKLALMISIMPFHAIFAVGILMSRSLIGESFYKTIDVAWVGDLMADQNIAGQITWFMGEVPLFLAVGALAAQWFTQDKVDAAAIDSRADHSDEDPFDAYNDMLAQLADHDRKSERQRFIDELGKRS